MKLNKPPITQEQSILEEYVEFLLIDHSNVHPFPSEVKQDSSDKNKPNISRYPQENLRPIQAPLKASEKIASAENQTVDESQNILDSVSVNQSEVINEAESESKPVNQSKVEVKGIDANVNLRKHQYVEPSEEEQLQQWNELIAKQSAESTSLAASQITQQNDEYQKMEETKNLTNEIILKTEPVQPLIPAAQLVDAAEDLVDGYFPQEKDQRLADVEQLLARISLANMPDVKVAELDVAETSEKLKQPVGENQLLSDQQTISQTEQATFVQREAQKAKEILPDVFQTLIFKVAKLPLAVPLIKLGGIMKFSPQDLTPLVGTPNWFMGLVRRDGGSLMVIDTRQYLMPEQAKVSETDEYQYLIVLDDSNWALACNSVGDAKNLTHNDIRWSEKSSKRPWFAGMVIDYMSALIEVDELINLLASNIVEKRKS